MPAPASLWQLEHGWTGFPRLRGSAAADVVVVGAGVTGCACALALAQHGADVVVLEAGETAAGASGRNGGFASAGTGLAPGAAAEAIGMRSAVALHRATEAALDDMLAIAAAQGEPDAVRRTGSLWAAADDEAAAMDAAAAALASAGVECRRAPELVPAPMRARYPHALLSPGDCVLQPARWTRALARTAAAAGARIHEGSPVTGIEPVRGGLRAVAPGGGVTAAAVVVACDGLIPRLVPELRGIVYPVRGQMLATEPLPDPVAHLPVHCDHGFVYLRPTFDGRLAIGGCRTADLDAEYTSDERTTGPVQRAIERFVSERLGLAGARITHRWAGIMGFSADLLPVVGPVPGRDGLHVAGGYSGVGNVQGFVCGRIVADLIAGRPHPLAAPLSVSRFGLRPSGPP
jgi:glycine/D-amino acid oxidase-like deaminating enzyme